MYNKMDKYECVSAGTVSIELRKRHVHCKNEGVTVTPLNVCASRTPSEWCQKTMTPVIGASAAQGNVIIDTVFSVIQTPRGSI